MSNVKIVAENYIKSAFYITQAFGVVGKFSQILFEKKSRNNGKTLYIFFLITFPILTQKSKILV